MTNDGTEKNDVKVPEEKIGEEITDAFNDGKDLLVTIVSAMGEEQVRFISGSRDSSLSLRCLLGYFLEGSPEGQLIFGVL